MNIINYKALVRFERLLPASQQHATMNINNYKRILINLIMNIDSKFYTSSVGFARGCAPAPAPRASPHRIRHQRRSLAKPHAGDPRRRKRRAWTVMFLEQISYI